MTPRHKLRIATMIAALAGLSLAISALPGAAAAPPAAPLLMLEYTWTGLGNDDDFDHWCNWDTTNTVRPGKCWWVDCGVRLG